MASASQLDDTETVRDSQKVSMTFPSERESDSIPLAKSDITEPPVVVEDQKVQSRKYSVHADSAVFDDLFNIKSETEKKEVKVVNKLQMA